MIFLWSILILIILCRCWCMVAAPSPPRAVCGADMPIVVITLPSRRQNVIEFLSSMGFRATLFQAVEKNTLSYDNAHNLAPGALACALSHITVWKEFLQTEHESIIVFEDDVKVVPKDQQQRVLKDMEAGIKELPTSWEILYLGWCYSKCNQHEGYSEHLVEVKGSIHCTHAYCVTRKGAEKLLRMIEHPLPEPIDEIMARATYSGALKTFAMKKPIFVQNERIISAINGMGAERGEATLCY